MWSPNWDTSTTLEKLENRDSSGTFKKPEKQDMLLKWGRKSGKAGPNLILENLFNCKSSFMCDLTKKPTIFREQNLKHFNIISFHLKLHLQLLKVICKPQKVPWNWIAYYGNSCCGTWFDIIQKRSHLKIKSFQFHSNIKHQIISKR